MALTIAGCSHRVLTIFFTGVPDPNARDIQETVQPTLEQEASVVAQMRDIAMQEHFTHGPWVNRECDMCHAARGGGKFNAITTAGNSQARLIYSIDELCASCHSDNKFTGDSKGLWRHGPVANGDCTTCHNPHKSRRQFMLLADDNHTLCGNCHSGNTAPDGDVHSANRDADCVNCHNPHGSGAPMLLKAGLAP